MRDLWWLWLIFAIIGWTVALATAWAFGGYVQDSGNGSHEVAQ